VSQLPCTPPPNPRLQVQGLLQRTEGLVWIYRLLGARVGRGVILDTGAGLQVPELTTVRPMVCLKRPPAAADSPQQATLHDLWATVCLWRPWLSLVRVLGFRDNSKP
jgi:hypothetical protein